MPFTLSKCSIPGLFEIQPKVFGDSRGYFLETWNKKELAKLGLDVDFVQDNQSFSTRGILRGLHAQRQHPQGKLVRAVSGQVYDVAVDIRKGSPSFGRYHALILCSEKQNQFYIPPGFAHGFLVLTESAVFAYKCTDYYHPEDEIGIIWNDPEINIPWPIREVKLSAKDAVLPPLKKLCL